MPVLRPFMPHTTVYSAEPRVFAVIRQQVSVHMSFHKCAATRVLVLYIISASFGAAEDGYILRYLLVQF